MAIYRFKAEVTATVTKALETAGNEAIGAADYVRVRAIWWDNATANAGNNLLFDNEDNDGDFWSIALDVAGSSGYVKYTGDGLELPKGEDIDITLSGGTTSCYVVIEAEVRRAQQ